MIANPSMRRRESGFFTGHAGGLKPVLYPSPAFAALVRTGSAAPIRVRQAVASILAAVQRRGDTALVDLTRRFDGVRLSPAGLRVPSAALRRARVAAELEKAARATLREVTAFARASLPRDWRKRNGHGAWVGERFDPLRRVGVYVPGGSAPLVSTVFMTVALARAAGVREVVACSPPPIAEPLLWALNLCGVTEVYQLGGAQAVAAMACGTRRIQPVDKIFGPGNVYVTEAKRQVFGVAGVDLLAGPSELMLLADETARADWAAADLLAQAEHGSGAERIFCVSSSLRVLQAVQRHLHEQSRACLKNTGLRRVLERGCWFIRTRDRDGMIAVANRVAPEHLQIMTRQPDLLASRIVTAGGIFFGNHTPTVVGDFVAGPSHTLPTGGAGRAFSGLRAADFMRRTSVIQYPAKALAKAAGGVAAFAAAEGLPAHAASVAIRLRARLKGRP